LGAALGAQRGIGTEDGVPADWFAKVNRGRHMLETALAVIDARKELFADGPSAPQQAAKL
jgi:hypothetical protein